MVLQFVAQAATSTLGAIGAGSSRDAKNREARKLRDQQNKISKERQREANAEGKRQGKYREESVEIARRNQDRNIELRQLQADNQRQYQQDFIDRNYENQLRIQAEQERVAQQQLGFNQDAFDLAMAQQENYMFDQNLMLDLTEQFAQDEYDLNAFKSDSQFQLASAQTNFARNKAASDFQIDQNISSQQQRATRSENNFQMQLAQIKSLKDQGSAKARGQSGRTAGKNIQAAIAENGIQQAIIAEKTMLAGEQYLLSTEQNVKKLEDASKELLIQQVNNKMTKNIADYENEYGLYKSNINTAFSRDSLRRSDILAKDELAKQLEQANARAMNSIMLDPLPPVTLPETPNFADYKAEIQDAYEWVASEVYDLPDAPQQQGNFFTDFLGAGGGQAISSGAGAFGNFLGNTSVPTGVNNSFNLNVPQFDYQAPNLGFGQFSNFGNLNTGFDMNIGGFQL